jgi:hypothetical protein
MWFIYLQRQSTYRSILRLSVSTVKGKNLGVLEKNFTIFTPVFEHEGQPAGGEGERRKGGDEHCRAPDTPIPHHDCP